MASYNFNKPVPADLYADDPDAVLQQLRNATDSLAKMLDGTSDTNVPDGAIRINSGQGYRLEKWNATGSTWDAITLGLGNLNSRLVNLTTGELQNAIENIDTVSVSNTQWGYLGGLGSAPLEDDDLAANGGDVTTEGNQNVFTTRQEIKAGPSLQFRTDRDNSGSHWDILRNGGLIARVEATSGNIRWRAEGGSVTSEFWTNSTRRGYFDPDGGFVMDGATGGSQGSGTVNGTIYDNSSRVYSASNAPASTALSDQDSAVVDVGGAGSDFDAGSEVRCERIGNWVTITSIGSLSHSSAASPSSSSGAIPSQFRPSSTARNVYSTWVNASFPSDPRISAIGVDTGGDFNLDHRLIGDGSTVSETSSGVGSVSISYLIT